jgi:hypothetical protein
VVRLWQTYLFFCFAIRHIIIWAVARREVPSPTAMSVLIETTAGDIVIDLLVDYAPKLCEK